MSPGHLHAYSSFLSLGSEKGICSSVFLSKLLFYIEPGPLLAVRIVLFGYDSS